MMCSPISLGQGGGTPTLEVVANMVREGNIRTNIVGWEMTNTDVPWRNIKGDGGCYVKKLCRRASLSDCLITHLPEEIAEEWLRELWPYLTDEFSDNAFNSSPTELLEAVKLLEEASRRTSIKAQEKEKIRGSFHYCWKRGRLTESPSEAVGRGDVYSAWYFEAPTEVVGEGIEILPGDCRRERRWGVCR
eukprot:Gb_35527 [translate_table: standard]